MPCAAYCFLAFLFIHLNMACFSTRFPLGNRFEITRSLASLFKTLIAVSSQHPDSAATIPTVSQSLGCRFRTSITDALTGPFRRGAGICLVRCTTLSNMIFRLGTSCGTNVPNRMVCSRSDTVTPPSSDRLPMQPDDQLRRQSALAYPYAHRARSE